jgi:hypothetical protein
MIIRKKTLNLTIFIFTICLVIPAIFYSINFWGSNLSKTPAVWGAFGDFFGGILNPIIALFGTIILGYLTYEISKQSSDQNLNLFLTQQKIIAYQKIASLKSEIDAAYNNAKMRKGLIVKFSELEEKEVAKDQYIKGIEDLIMSSSNLQISIANFPINYGHLFSYDFESDKYKSLKEGTSANFDLIAKLEVAEKKDLDFTDDELMKGFKDFLIDLKEEINPTNV